MQEFLGFLYKRRNGEIVEESEIAVLGQFEESPDLPNHYAVNVFPEIGTFERWHSNHPGTEVLCTLQLRPGLSSVSNNLITLAIQQMEKATTWFPKERFEALGFLWVSFEAAEPKAPEAQQPCQSWRDRPALL